MPWHNGSEGRVILEFDAGTNGNFLLLPWIIDHCR